LTASFGRDDCFLVQGLDLSNANVEQARRHIRSLGRYGRVSVDTFDGQHLPYADNLVNLIVAEDLRDVSMDEVMRVLAPLGVAYINGKKTVKPWSQEIDEWTHFLHGPDNNAVAQDTVVGPPRRSQWLCGRAWARHHDGLAFISAMVSTQGRIFYIIDEAPTMTACYWLLATRIRMLPAAQQPRGVATSPMMPRRNDSSCSTPRPVRLYDARSATFPPQTLAAHGNLLFYHSGNVVTCADYPSTSDRNLTHSELLTLASYAPGN